MGMAAARNEKNSAILTGLEMVAKQFQDFLGETGVQTIDAVGQKFDPNLHEAIAQEASAEVPEGHVVKQIRRGYKLKDRLLRPGERRRFQGQGEVNQPRRTQRAQRCRTSEGPCIFLSFALFAPFAVNILLNNFSWRRPNAITTRCWKSSAP